jgi:GntR family transcriptional regulator / MocR family aminotransferase
MKSSKPQRLQSVTDVTWRRLFGALNKDGQALNLQIRRMIVNAIETGVLSQNTRLPSTRQLAGLLGIARNTVTTAYQLLTDEGFLVSKERSGIFVAASGAAPVVNRQQSETFGDWQARFALRACRRYASHAIGWNTPIHSCSASMIPRCFRPTTGAKLCEPLPV